MRAKEPMHLVLISLNLARFSSARFGVVSSSVCVFVCAARRVAVVVLYGRSADKFRLKMRQKGVPARLEQDGSNKPGQVEGSQGDGQASWFEAPEMVAMTTEAASSQVSTDEEDSSRPDTMGDVDCSDDSWFVCEHCRSLFESPSSLAAHVEEQHTVVLSSPGYWGKTGFGRRKKKTVSLEERRKKSRERMREKRNNMTEEEREAIREKARLAKRDKFHNLAQDKKEKERERARVYMRKKRMTMTEEERNKVREKARLAKRLKTATMPEPEKEKMKEKARIRMKQKRENMTEAERETMREKARIHARQRRLAQSYLKSHGQGSSDAKHCGGTIAEDLMAALRNWEDSESNTSEDTMSTGNKYDIYLPEEQQTDREAGALGGDKGLGSSMLQSVQPSQRTHEGRDHDPSQNMLQFQALNTES